MCNFYCAVLRISSYSSFSELVFIIFFSYKGREYEVCLKSNENDLYKSCLLILFTVQYYSLQSMPFVHKHTVPNDFAILCKSFGSPDKLFKTCVAVFECSLLYRSDDHLTAVFGWIKIIRSHIWPIEDIWEYKNFSQRKFI